MQVLFDSLQLFRPPECDAGPPADWDLHECHGPVLGAVVPDEDLVALAAEAGRVGRVWQREARGDAAVLRGGVGGVAFGAARHLEERLWILRLDYMCSK